MLADTVSSDRNIVARVPLNPGWTKIPGVKITSDGLELDPRKYFFRYESPAWRMIPWKKVRENWDALVEDGHTTLEQRCLEFIEAEAFVTEDAGEVLENAWNVYSFLYDVENDTTDELAFVTPRHLDALRETSTMMSLNLVAIDGRIRNVSPAWFFALASQVIWGFSDQEAIEIDDLYHGGFFHEGRRADSLRAHTALGGRLIHGCQGSPNQSGGAVAPYGADVDAFHRELRSFKGEWMDEIRELLRL